MDRIDFFETLAYNVHMYFNSYNDTAFDTYENTINLLKIDFCNAL